MDAKSRANVINSVASGQKIPCPACDSLNESNSIFCIICGTKLIKMKGVFSSQAELDHANQDATVEYAATLEQKTNQGNRATISGQMTSQTAVPRHVTIGQPVPASQPAAPKQATSGQPAVPRKASATGQPVPASQLAVPKQATSGQSAVPRKASATGQSVPAGQPVPASGPAAPKQAASGQPVVPGKTSATGQPVSVGQPIPVSQPVVSKQEVQRQSKAQEIPAVAKQLVPKQAVSTQTREQETPVATKQLSAPKQIVAFEPVEVPKSSVAKVEGNISQMEEEQAFQEIASTKEEIEEEAVSAFAQGLPAWSIVPPRIMVRRKKKK